MASIIQKPFDQLLGGLPVWEEFQSSAEQEVLIAAAGFEDRTVSICERWLANCKDFPRAVLIIYKTNPVDNQHNLERFRELLLSRRAVVEEVEYDQRTISAKIAKALGRFSDTPQLLVDISSMASFVLYPLLRAIFDAVPESRLGIGYAEAAYYFPEEDEWNSFWKTLSDKDIVGRAELFEKQYFQSKGAERIYEALNFVGRNPSELPGKLVMIPNFSFHRIFNMREYNRYDPR